MDGKCIFLGERSQSERATYHMNPVLEYSVKGNRESRKSVVSRTWVLRDTVEQVKIQSL